LGLSTILGPRLRTLVETQLIKDLRHYGVEKQNLKFDWSESCIEGHDTDYLDGRLENFSGIAVFDQNDNLIADGWMEFIHRGQFFLAYWEFVTIWDKDTKVFEKKTPGMPGHILNQIPDDIKTEIERKIG
ncbi:MAG: hypothetical protein ACKO96_45820, partial [Flammeovirgaceae bacterium]